MIMSVMDLTYQKYIYIPTWNPSDNMLRGHSRIKASTCIPRRWMAGSPCWWPIGVEIEMNPYIPEKSHVSHGCFFLPKLLNWETLNLRNPWKPFSIWRSRGIHGKKSTHAVQPLKRYHPRFGCHHGWLGSSIEDLLWHGACAGRMAGWSDGQL